MTIALFLDTNIIMRDFKMNGHEFNNLFNASKEFREKDVLKLFITQMNYLELMKKYERELKQAFKCIKEYRQITKKLFNDTDFFITEQDWKENHLHNFKKLLEKNFDIYEPSSKEVYDRVLERFYFTKRPFRENKDEFRDAVIWETIYDYAKEHPDEKVYFVSNNKKDFAYEEGEKDWKLHPDFDDLEGRIIYFQTINEFLAEIDYLKIYHFDFREREEIRSLILDYLKEFAQYDANIDSALFDFFSNRIFASDYFEGWGTDYQINNISNLSIDEYEDILEQGGTFVVPIQFDAEIEYKVETLNPVYEPGDEEYLQSEPIFRIFEVICKAVFNAKENKVEKIIDAEILF